MRRFLLVVLLATACRSAGDFPLEKAIVVPADVEKAIAFERTLAASYETLPAEGEEWFTVVRGTAPILIVAGHATAQTREGALKVADRGTGSLAVALHAMTGATVIHNTRRSPSDPNYYDDNAFKETVARLIDEVKPRLVLDLHASHSLRPYDADFGVMGGRSLLGRDDLLERLARRLRNEGLMNLSRDYFAAARNQTITKFVSARGVPCIQVEISATWLDPGRDSLHGHRFAQLLQGLVRFVVDVTGTQPAVSGSDATRSAGGGRPLQHRLRR